MGRGGGGTRRNPEVRQAKQSVYLPAEMVEELQREAVRLDRSTSWLLARAWKISRAEVSGAGHPGDSAATLRGHAAQEEDRDPSRPHRDD